MAASPDTHADDAVQILPDKPGFARNPKPVNNTSGNRVYCNPMNGALNINADTMVYFSPVVRHLFVQNNSSASVFMELEAISGPGSFQLTPGAWINLDVQVSEVHFFCTQATQFNNPQTAGVIVWGWR